MGRGKLHGFFIVVILTLVEGALLGYTQRSLFYGAVPGFVIAGGAVLLISLGMRRRLCLRLNRLPFALGFVAVLQIVILAPTYWLLRAPTAQDVIQKYIGVDGSRIRIPRIFCVWRRDPTYLVKLRIDEAELRRIIKAVHGLENVPPRSASQDLACYKRDSVHGIKLPSWWAIERISDARTWRGKSRAGPRVRMRYDPLRHELYLEILFM